MSDVKSAPRRDQTLTVSQRGEVPGEAGARIFLVDNYDSFTYNLFQYLSELGAVVDVRRNDRFELEEIAHIRPDAIVISRFRGDKLVEDFVQWDALGLLRQLGVSPAMGAGATAATATKGTEVRSH